MEQDKKKKLTEEERLELAAKLDAELNEYVRNLEKRSYTEGWPEDRWEEEMEKHPFFMKQPPKPGDELSPLMEGLQQLKYSADENTPEELANNYKEDGNFNYKHKNYRLATLSYTEGIRTNCENQELMAQLYNNRAAAQFMLENYRSSLNDCQRALKLQPKYPKALNRAANCCFNMKDYGQCIDLCDQFLDEYPTDAAMLNLKTRAIAARERARRDQRKRERQGRQSSKQIEELLETIQSRGVKIELPPGKEKPDMSDLEPQIPQLLQNTVHLHPDDKLVWPVIILYPEVHQTDFIQNFDEDTTLVEYLEQLFKVPPEWDTQERYSLDNVNVYFEGKGKRAVHKVNINLQLDEILRDDRFYVRGGAPAFLVFVKSSPAEKRFLSKY